MRRPADGQTIGEPVLERIFDGVESVFSVLAGTGDFRRGDQQHGVVGKVALHIAAEVRELRFGVTEFLLEDGNLLASVNLGPHAFTLNFFIFLIGTGFISIL